MPTLLYIDTSADHIAIAVSRNGRVQAENRQYTTHQQAALINVMIGEILEDANLSLPEIDAIAVCAGPGSYTGLRVGLSAAKGLCFALKKPLMLFHKLFLIALSASRPPESAMLIALKARQDELFIAGYDHTLAEILPPQHVCLMNLKLILPAYDIVLTNYEELPVFEDSKILPLHHEINMEKWSVHAAERYAQQAYDDLAYSEPFYLKAAFTTTAKKKIQ